jgi:hypothetical protein
METWLLTFEEFCKKVRAVVAIAHRFAPDEQFTQWRSRSMQNHFAVYVDSETLAVVNPFVKKFDKSRRSGLKCFSSSYGAWQAKRAAYCWIIQRAKEEGLFNPAACPENRARQILEQSIIKENER